MSDVEFSSVGEAFEAGVDIETAGEAMTYAGADPVDAAIGAVRRMYPQLAQRRFVNAGAQKAKGMFTYWVGLGSVTAIGGGTGTLTVTCNTPYQVIDAIAQGAASTWRLTSFYIGDTNMLLGAGAIALDNFFPAVQGRGVRYTTLQRGQTCAAAVINVTQATTALTCGIDLKVRSYRRS